MIILSNLNLHLLKYFISMVLTFSVNIQHYFVPKIKEINFLAQWNVDTLGMKGNKHRMRGM